MKKSREKLERPISKVAGLTAPLPAISVLQGKTHGKLPIIEGCITKLPDIAMLLESSPLDKSGPKIVLVSEAFESFFGYRREEVVGRNPRFLHGKKTNEETLDEIYKSLKKHAPISRRLVNYDKKGREQRVEMEVIPLPDETQKSKYSLVIQRRIAENKKQGEELRLSSERFSQAFEYGPIGMAIVAPDGHWLTVNRCLCDLLGYSGDELTHTTFQRLTHPEDLSEELELARKTVNGELDFYRMEKRFVHKEGQPVWIHLTGSLVRDSDGRPLYFIQQVQNITETKLAGEKIAEQAALLDKTNDAIILCSLDGRILFWNKGAEAIYGWKADEVAGRLIRELNFKKNVSRYDEACRVTLETGKWTSESPVIHKAGGELVVQSHWTLIKDEANRPKAFLEISFDITDRKQMEAQLMRAQRMESIGTLAGGIAHDLNNILSPIMMSIEMLKRTSTHPQALSIINTIEITSRRGADIVRQVLSFARGMKGDRIEVQPRHLLKDIQALIQETLPKDIQLKYFFPNNSWTLLGDPTQIHQILMNLCVNARDAMPKGGSLTITAENAVIDEQYASMHMEAKPGKYVAIGVADTGTGIPPEILDKIFDPFFTTKEIGKGTGLGLSTVIAIVKGHEGFLNVSSEPGKGTTFKVYLPAIEHSEETKDAKEEMDALPRGRGETVLIVDDEASILTITGQTLDAFGYKILTANDGVEALARYAEHRDKIAVVLTDMAMPVMDGPSMIRVLLKMNPNVKVIAASGLKTSEALVRESNFETKYFIDKPYTAGTLLRTLRAILDEPAHSI